MRRAWAVALAAVLISTACTSGRIVRVDDMTGAGWITLGDHKPPAIVLDHGGRIYATDYFRHRIVRVDGMTGSGWTTLGGHGTGLLQVNGPTGIALDAAGRIYVADSGNGRIVRMDDMTGAGWTAFGSQGAGAHQFKSPAGIAVDAASRIYVADSGNNRIVRMEDMAGAPGGTCLAARGPEFVSLRIQIGSLLIPPAGSTSWTLGLLQGLVASCEWTTCARSKE